MILDSISHWERYRSLSPGFVKAFEFLSRPESLRLEPSERGPRNSLRLPIEGDKIFSLVQRYDPKPIGEAMWEAHRKYIDLQFVAEGAEAMLWAPLASMRIVQAYDEANDFTKLAPQGSAPGQALRVCEGMFAIFMPHDAHAPGLAIEEDSREVKKIVVKIAV